MLSINNSCLLLLTSIASLTSAQPMSLSKATQPRLGCNFVFCSGSILGESWILYDNFQHQFSHVAGEAVETCLHKGGSSEEVLNCIEDILNSNSQGDCKACICDVLPQICQKNQTMQTEIQQISDIKEAKVEIRSEVEVDNSGNEPAQPRLGCNFISCSGSILGEFSTLYNIFFDPILLQERL